MNKMVMSGALTAALIVGGGTGFYLANAKGNVPTPAAFMQQRVNIAPMSNQIKSNGSSDDQQSDGFEQMKPYMKQMHPDLSDKQLEQLYESMHGSDGACGGDENTSNNGRTDNNSGDNNAKNQSFQGMMGTNL